MRISVLISALLFCVFVSPGSAELSRDKSLSGADAPPRSVLRDEIAVLKDIVGYGPEREDRGY